MVQRPVSPLDPVVGFILGSNGAAVPRGPLRDTVEKLAVTLTHKAAPVPVPQGMIHRSVASTIDRDGEELQDLLAVCASVPHRSCSARMAARFCFQALLHTQALLSSLQHLAQPPQRRFLARCTGTGFCAR